MFRAIARMSGTETRVAILVPPPLLGHMMRRDSAISNAILDNFSRAKDCPREADLPESLVESCGKLSAALFHNSWLPSRTDVI